MDSPPRGVLTDGRKITKELFRSVLAEELEKIKTSIGAERYAKGKFDIARELFDKITTDDSEFVEFPHTARVRRNWIDMTTKETAVDRSTSAFQDWKTSPRWSVYRATLFAIRR